MSTLTKVLIILQTILTCILCGIVVTYVGSANNYKEKADNFENQYRTNQQNAAKAQDQLKLEKEKANQTTKEFRDQIASLEGKINTLNTQLADAEREKSLLLQKVTNMASTLEASTTSTKQQTSLFETAQLQLDELRAEQIMLSKELKEAQDALTERMAINTTQEETIQQLTQKKDQLQSKIEQLIRQSGGDGYTPPLTIPNTPVPSPSELTPKGRITDIDLEDSLAEISIGAVDGVRKDMTFYITRDNRFICNLTITEVDTQRAAGILNMIQQTPRVGDQVSSNMQ